jgi:putative endonuclease
VKDSRATSRDRGAWAEACACDHLLRQGLQTLHRNYRCRAGEIDIILRDDQTIVFVEVRYRRQAGFGDGFDSVDLRKQHKLIAAASHFLMCHPELRDRPCRFDVVSLSAGNDAPKIEWLRNAFEA